MTRVKIVPDAEPNADGEWIELPLDFPTRTRWRLMETLVKPHIPAGYHAVSLERGPSK
jgi:hypothetical protein